MYKKHPFVRLKMKLSLATLMIYIIQQKLMAIYAYNRINCLMNALYKDDERRFKRNPLKLGFSHSE